jgi:hypothetical protein
MNKTKDALRSGDVVEVLGEDLIRATLGPEGMYEGIPFVPEMRRFTGRRLRVFKRADKVCIEGGYVSRLRNTVLLDGARCDGSEHEGCARMCLLLWKEAWLRRLPPTEPVDQPIDWMNIQEPEYCRADSYDSNRLCQSTALPRAVEPLRGWDIRQYVRDVTSRNFTLWQVTKAIFFGVFNMIMRYTGGREFGASVGQLVKTPEVALNLQPGELVEVKSKNEILATIDPQGRNRGLSIDFEMIRHAGKRFRVLRRVDRIVLETTGTMREIRNTVLLEKTECEGLCRRGCTRSSYPMWREAWLRRVSN